MNAQVALTSRRQRLDEVLQRWNTSYQQVVATLQALDAAAFDPAGPLVTALGDSIDGAFGNNTYGHHAEHRAQIEAWLATGSQWTQSSSNLSA